LVPGRSFPFSSTSGIGVSTSPSPQLERKRLARFPPFPPPPFFFFDAQETEDTPLPLLHRSDRSGRVSSLLSQRRRVPLVERGGPRLLVVRGSILSRRGEETWCFLSRQLSTYPFFPSKLRSGGEFWATSSPGRGAASDALMFSDFSGQVV